jgi:outer membrane protein assembly factor BamE (lipoprotein component of BamABCDE complex)
MTGGVLTVGLAALALAGCVTASVGRPFNAEARRQVRVHVTTKDDVRRLLGEPDQVLSNPERETWVYRHFKATVEVFAQTTTDATPSEELSIAFKDGVVTDCDYVYEEVTTGMLSGMLKKRIADKCVAQPLSR